MKLLFQWRKEPQGIAESIASYFQRNYGKRITLDTVCEEYHYSKNYLIRVFSKKYHMTPNVYLNHLRMEQAERLLEATPDSLLNISERCGFASYSHFCKTFFRYHQMSPSQWREEKKNIDHQMEDDNGLFKR